MERTGSQILFQALQERRGRYPFGYPGGGVMDIYDELYRQAIRHILVRHEQGAIHAADGLPGPPGGWGSVWPPRARATNTVTGSPMPIWTRSRWSLLTGQVSTAMIGNDGFQEVDIIGITRTCTKHNFLVRRMTISTAPSARPSRSPARAGRAR